MTVLLLSLLMAFMVFTAYASNTEISTTPLAEANETLMFDGGTGTEEDPYQIASVDSLLSFGISVNDGSQMGYVDKYIQLTADIDLTGVEWTPIGKMNFDDMEDMSPLFLGSFDGGNHTISNLSFFTDEYIAGAGVFGISMGNISNLAVENATVEVTEGMSSAISAVVGFNMGGNLDNLSIKGATITGNNCIGGIAGGNENGTVKNCSAEDVTVIVIGDNEFTDRIIQADVAECGGLIIGGGFGGSVDNCSASGTVKADGKSPVGLGGIGGCLEMMDSITNCKADVTIETSGGGHAIGGLCGYSGTHTDPNTVLEFVGTVFTNYPSIIDNCEVNITIKADDATHVGGLVGTGLYYFGEETAFAITNCSISGSIDGAVTPGTIAGRAEGSTIQDCTVDVTIDGVSADNEVGETTCMYESSDQ